MQVVTLVLNKTELLEALLEELYKAGVHGATVLESTGMARVLDASGDDLPMFGALRQLLDPQRTSSKTVVMVLRDEQVEGVRAVIRRVTGGLNHPDTGILFTVPALTMEGLEDDPE